MDASTSPSNPDALGQSEAFLRLQAQISLAARTDRPVILIGERGTGKELAAARLHGLSARWNRPYVTLNCASLAPTLIESELFGHEAGAFTGAQRRRKGRFEMADGGTLFLDEVGNIPLTAQEKILRVVEYGQMERVGSSESIQADARLIAATNVDLRRMADEGRFRQDLLDRLSFEVITLPPLRARHEDIPLLAQHFARRMAGEMGLAFTPSFSPHASAALLDWPWPGNIRELKNVVERMIYRSGGAGERVIETIIFDPFESAYAPRGGIAAGEEIGAEGGWGEMEKENEKEKEKEFRPGGRVMRSDGARAMRGDGAGAGALLRQIDELPLADAVRALEVGRLRRALVVSRFNQRQAAERLGLTYHQFRAYYRKYKAEIA